MKKSKTVATIAACLFFVSILFLSPVGTDAVSTAPADSGGSSLQNTINILNSLVENLQRLLAAQQGNLMAAAAVPTDSLLAHFAFDEGTGAAASGGGSLSASFLSGATWTAGKVGTNAVNFDGAAGQLNLTGLSISGAYTISMWVKPVPPYAYAWGALLFDDTFGNGTGLEFKGDGSKKITFFNQNDHLTKTALTENAWNHVVAVSDGSSVYLYVNGILDNTFAGAAIGFVPNKIGNDKFGEHFHGAIDDIWVFSRALTATEIDALYNYTGSVTPPPPAPAPVPALSAGSPSGQLSSSVTSANLSVSTDIASTCKYSGTAGVAYSGMSNNFSTANGTAHTASLSGLLAGNSYNYFVRCMGTAGGVNSLDFQISFAVASVVVPPPPPPSGGISSWYVSPSGSSSGNGSLSNPWNLQTALNQPSAIHAGDTIWLRGGTYVGPFTSKLLGTASAPITVRNYNNERATITAYISQTSGGYTNYWGLEITDLTGNRLSSQTGSAPTDIPNSTIGGFEARVPNLKLINMIIHDVTGNAVGFWAESPNSGVYGSVIYNNGWNASDRGHGHGVYTQNNYLNQPKTISNNIFLANYGYLFQAYGSSDSNIIGYNIDKNILIGGAGGFVGGRSGTPVQGISITNNLLYNSSLSLGYEGTTVTNDLTLQNNYLSSQTDIRYFWQRTNISGNTVFDNGNNGLVNLSTGTFNPSTWNWNNNTYYSNGGNYSFNISGTSWYSFAGWKTKTGFDSASTYKAINLAPDTVFVLPNAYESGRGNIAIYNWSQKASVSVDLTSLGFVSGDTYELHNAANYYGDILTGTYGGVLAVPMTGHTPVSQINTSDAPLIQNTFPTFGAFVIIKTGHSSNPPPPPPSPTPDTTAPTVSITSPTNLGTVSGASVTVSANASDPIISGQTQSGISGVQFKVDGNNLGSEDTVSPYSVTWNTSSLSNGNHTLTAVARDGAGNSSMSSVITVSVSNVVIPTNLPPTISVPAPMFITIPVTTVSLSGTASDDGLPAGSSLSISWSKVSGPGTVVFNPSTGSGQTTATFGSAGVYVLQLRASDGQYNTTATVSITVLPHTAPPIRSAGSPSGTLPGTTAQVVVSLNTDENSTCRWSN
ncbi:MAG: LamG-like jellyroll fold domain-containing protein, partial [Candidatus Paceibacterota bacterium]